MSNYSEALLDAIERSLQSSYAKVGEEIERYEDALRAMATHGVTNAIKSLEFKHSVGGKAQKTQFKLKQLALHIKELFSIEKCQQFLTELSELDITLMEKAGKRAKQLETNHKNAQLDKKLQSMREKAQALIKSYFNQMIKAFDEMISKVSLQIDRVDELIGDFTRQEKEVVLEIHDLEEERDALLLAIKRHRLGPLKKLDIKLIDALIVDLAKKLAVAQGQGEERGCRVLAHEIAYLKEQRAVAFALQTNFTTLAFDDETLSLDEFKQYVDENGKFTDTMDAARFVVGIDDVLKANEHGVFEAYKLIKYHEKRPEFVQAHQEGHVALFDENHQITDTLDDALYFVDNVQVNGQADRLALAKQAALKQYKVHENQWQPTSTSKVQAVSGRLDELYYKEKQLRKGIDFLNDNRQELVALLDVLLGQKQQVVGQRDDLLKHYQGARNEPLSRAEPQKVLSALLRHAGGSLEGANLQLGSLTGRVDEMLGHVTSSQKLPHAKQQFFTPDSGKDPFTETYYQSGSNHSKH